MTAPQPAPTVLVIDIPPSACAVRPPGAHA